MEIGLDVKRGVSHLIFMLDTPVFIKLRISLSNCYSSSISKKTIRFSHDKYYMFIKNRKSSWEVLKNARGAL
jgi:hypothetical protein